MNVNHSNTPVAETYPDYRFHVSESVINTAEKKMLGTLFIDGMAFESESDSVIENAFNDLKTYLVAVGKEGDISLWSHLVKKECCLMMSIVSVTIF